MGLVREFTSLQVRGNRDDEPYKLIVSNLWENIQVSGHHTKGLGRLPEVTCEGRARVARGRRRRRRTLARRRRRRRPLSPTPGSQGTPSTAGSWPQN